MVGEGLLDTSNPALSAKDKFKVNISTQLKPPCVTLHEQCQAWATEIFNGLPEEMRSKYKSSDIVVTIQNLNLGKLQILSVKN